MSALPYSQSLYSAGSLLYDFPMKKALLALLLIVGMPHAAANDTPPSVAIPNPTTMTVVPNSTTVTVVPNSTTITLPNGATVPPGAVLIPPPGLGAAGTVAGNAGSAPATTTSEKIEVTEDQISTLNPEQRAAMEKALESAKAAMPATEERPAIPAAIAGITPKMLSSLTPEQLKLLEEAKSTGTIPAELKSLIANLADIPGDVYAKLSDQQKEIIEKARASGVLDKAMLNDILDGLTADEVKAFTSGKSISTDVIKKAAAKRTISCTKGKKTVSLVAKSCPKGFTRS